MKQRDGTVVHQLQEKVADLQGVVAAQGAAETRWRGERAALLSQLDTLNDQLVRSQHKIEAIEAENRKMAQVIETLHCRVLCFLFEDSCYDPFVLVFTLCIVSPRIRVG